MEEELAIEVDTHTIRRGERRRGGRGEEEEGKRGGGEGVREGGGRGEEGKESETVVVNTKLH